MQLLVRLTVMMLHLQGLGGGVTGRGVGVGVRGGGGGCGGRQEDKTKD